MKKMFNLKLLLGSSFLFVQSLTSLTAATLLVDFNSGDNGGSPGVTTAADFQAENPDVELVATVNDVDADSNNTNVALTGVAVNATFTQVEGGAFNANGGSRNDLAILDGYLFQSFGDGPGFQIGSLEEVPTGATVTVTIWSIGDADDQFANEIELRHTNTLNPIITDTPTAETTTPTSATDFVRTLTFTKEAGIDAIDIQVRRANRFSSVNGIAITFDENFVVPEPSSSALLALGGLALLGRRKRA